MYHSFAKSNNNSEWQKKNSYLYEEGTRRALFCNIVPIERGKQDCKLLEKMNDSSRQISAV